MHVNDLRNSLNVLVPIMFADDTNLFFERSNINTLFEIVKLIGINEWFSGKKLSINVGKTKFSLFHKPDRKYSIPSPPPTLKVSIHHIERASTMKFLHVLLDENLSREEHIKYLENKMCRAKPLN